MTAHSPPLLPFPTTTPTATTSTSTSSSARTADRDRRPSLSSRRPSPSRHHHHPHHHNQHQGTYAQFLTQRARTTNLAVLILVFISTVSLLVNLRVWLGEDVFVRPEERGLGKGRVPQSIKGTLRAPGRELGALRHLVMVPGHAIFLGCSASQALQDESWILEPFQKGGSVKTFIRHITKAFDVEITVQDPEALLVFSGPLSLPPLTDPPTHKTSGQTRHHAEWTEAMSYAHLAKAGNLYSQFASRDASSGGASTGLVGEDFDRVTTENYALDSFENLLFSIARFKEFTGHYPTRITTVGFGMKRPRFEDVHRAALRWPIESWRYFGIDDEGDVREAYEGEGVSGRWKACAWARLLVLSPTFRFLFFSHPVTGAMTPSSGIFASLRSLEAERDVE
ncbi:hypothetical protein T439DRAFT_332632 [Meredithblackwellia eburnea MCA 4105]